jgi:hypothetical protein
MPKVTGFNRKRIGHRNYLATIQNPPTTQDEYGQISYSKILRLLRMSMGRSVTAVGHGRPLLLIGLAN